MNRQKIKKTIIDLTADIDAIKDKKALSIINALVELVDNLSKKNTLPEKTRPLLKTEDALLNCMKVKLTLNAAQLGYWSINLKTGKVESSLLHDKIFGYSTALPDWNYEKFLSRLHPMTAI